jgi:hypothetical protein
VELPGLSRPLEVSTAAVKLQEDRVDAEGQATMGELEISGSYRGRPAMKRPHRLALRVPSLTASDAAQLLAPTLERPRGFLSRTLRLSRGPVPGWLVDRHAEGTLEIGSLQLAGRTFEAVRLSFFWDGPVLEAPRFQARVAGGNLEGHLSMDFSGPSPDLKVAGRLESASWGGGRLEGDAVITTSGTGEDLYWNLRADGFFRTRAVPLVDELSTPALSGDWSLRWLRKRPKLQLSELRLADGQEVLTGQGTTTEDDRLLIDLSHGDRSLRLTGTLKPLRLEAAQAR